MCASTPSTAADTAGMPGTQVVHVVAGVIRNPQGEILLAKRPQHLHQGGLWEFPGGKCEPGEQAFEALQRELHEELGIDVHAAQPLISIPHSYPDKNILLDVWQVSHYEGNAFGKEQQQVLWVNENELENFTFPAANHPILTALKLPDVCLISPEPFADRQVFLSQLDKTLASGIRLLQLRARSLDDQDYVSLYQQVREICRRSKVIVMVNRSLPCFQQCNAAGLHMNSQQLHSVRQRPVDADVLLSASCHSEQDIEQACRLGVDFTLLSPVKPTRTHPEANPLGWQKFNELVSLATMPVYALGGMDRNDIVEAHKAGAQGIAAISSLWCE